MIVVIHGGEVFAPEPRGPQAVVMVGHRVTYVGAVKPATIKVPGVTVDVVDARGCVVVPGLIDPHEHLIGGSGERGFASQTPEIALRELVRGGITTVVGCLGVDTTTRTLPALLAKTKGLRKEGLSAFMYTGGYNVPPTTLTGSIRSDIMYLDPVLGAGEVAISDVRGTEPTVRELARLAHDAYVGGLLSGKCGVTHLHVGDKATRLAPVRELLDEHEVPPEWLYPTHVERHRALMLEAVELSARGVTMDIDVVEEDLPVWLRLMDDWNADWSRFTISSDAGIKAPATLHAQLVASVRQGFALERVLPLCTSNTARVLKLSHKGRLAPGVDADVLVLERDSLAVRHVFSRGRCLMRDGALRVQEAYLPASNRVLDQRGGKS
ncbi:MAG: amidohydrolase family protein [Myxococcota bacterium]